MGQSQTSRTCLRQHYLHLFICICCFWKHSVFVFRFFFSHQFSCSVVSESLQPHKLQHARPPCPSPTPGVHPNPCPLSQWCHPTISTSVTCFTSCPQSFPSSRSSPMTQLFTSSGQSTKMKNPIKLVIDSSRFYLDFNFFSVLID